MFSARISKGINLHICEYIFSDFVLWYLHGRKDKTLANHVWNLDSSLCSVRLPAWKGVPSIWWWRWEASEGSCPWLPVGDQGTYAVGWCEQGVGSAWEISHSKVKQKEGEIIAWIILQFPENHLVTLLMVFRCQGDETAFKSHLNISLFDQIIMLLSLCC